MGTRPLYDSINHNSLISCWEHAYPRPHVGCILSYTHVHVLSHAASGIIMIAEVVSAVKRALSRMLLIIVAMGFGTVKPRLGDSLGKVVAIGVVYTILACMDGIIRARNVSRGSTRIYSPCVLVSCASTCRCCLHCQGTCDSCSLLIYKERYILDLLGCQ